MKEILDGIGTAGAIFLILFILIGWIMTFLGSVFYLIVERHSYEHDRYRHNLEQKRLKGRRIAWWVLFSSLVTGVLVIYGIQKYIYWMDNFYSM